jgi:hypothetical protein
MRQLFGRNADARVADRNDYHIPFTRGGDVNPAIGRGEFDGVGDHVADDLLERVGISVDDKIAIRFFQIRLMPLSAARCFIEAVVWRRKWIMSICFLARDARPSSSRINFDPGCGAVLRQTPIVRSGRRD